MHLLSRGVAASLAALLLLSAACNRTPPGAIERSEVRRAIEVLSSASGQGFGADAFQAKRLAALSESKDDAQLRTRDALLRSELAAYARAQHGLSIPRRALPAEWGLRAPAYDADKTLTEAIAARRFEAWLDGQPSTNPGYQALQRGYVRYLRIAAAGGWPALSPARLRPGLAGAPVDALRRRLGIEDPAVVSAPAGAPFDAVLAAAVSRFQGLHGLPPTGVVDGPTLAELNVPATARLAQIRASLERLRWLPREDPPTRVDVNIAAATFDYYRDGRLAMHMLAASGKPGDETPMLQSAIDAIVLNPPWNVPESIAKDELYPKEASQPGYFATHGFVVQQDNEGPRLMQQPGPESALGLVKFNFKNPYAVYLHDTPSKAAFSRTQRAVSHGCVRLEQAVAFAKVLLADEPGWSAERVDQLLASGQTSEVQLSHRVPVRLVYLTAFAQGAAVAFRPDIYGWDSKLLQLLDARPTA